MGKYRAYAEYEDSGVEWLGEVPSHWNQKRVRFLLEDGNNGMKIGPFGSALKLEDMVDEGIKVYGQENVINNDFSLGKRRISPGKHTEMRVYDIKRGDLLVTMMGTSGRCQVVPPNAEEGIIDSHLLRLRPNPVEIYSELLRWIVDESPEVAHQVRLQGKGSIMHGLNSSIIKDLLLALPAVDEQIQIATFLDRETAKIDRLIAKQEALIELLKEKRQAVISHAVTKGLDPDAPMKDSGVEWLGEIPAHWEAVHAKRLFDEVEYGISSSTGPEGKYEVLTMGDIQDGRVLCPKERFVKEVPLGLLLEKGDLLFNRTNSLDLVGKVGLFEGGENVSFASYLVRIRPKVDVLSKYLNYFTNTEGVRGIARATALPSISQANLNPNRYGYIGLCKPPLDEQQAIVDHLDKEVQQIEKTVQKVATAITLLQERRTALISAAVTGKIDVREEFVDRPT